MGSTSLISLMVVLCGRKAPWKKKKAPQRRDAVHRSLRVTRPGEDQSLDLPVWPNAVNIASSFFFFFFSPFFTCSGYSHS